VVSNLSFAGFSRLHIKILDYFQGFVVWDQLAPIFVAEIEFEFLFPARSPADSQA
jgi:hypothetical protein